MERKGIKTGVGTISLDKIEFGEILVNVSFCMESIPDDIQEKLSSAIESDKMGQSQGMAWNDKSTDTEAWLHICIDNKGFSSWIGADAVDRENKMWASASIDVDLSEHAAELKQFIANAVLEEFFK